MPVSFELHATHFAGGRGSPSINQAWNRHKQNRRIVLQDALSAIDRSEVLRIGTACRQTTATGPDYAVERGSLYHQLVQHLDTRLGDAGEAGIMIMDGRPVESYYNAHRTLKLSNRNVVEDPFFVASERSQWVQMADITAWTAYQHLQNQEREHPAKNWYRDHLLASDVNGGPMEL